MSLSIYIKCKHCNAYLFDANITHNLGKMADKAGIYYAMWRPEEIGVTRPLQLVHILKKGIRELRKYPTYFHDFETANGWGKYEHLLELAVDYFKACVQYPFEVLEISK
jgi:hypothetical protein